MSYSKWYIATYTKSFRTPPLRTVCLRDDQRLRDSVCFWLWVGGRGWVGLAQSTAAAWPSVANWTQSACHCVQCDAQANMGGKVGLICCWTRELWRSKCNFLCICYLLLHKCCRVCLVRVAGVVNPLKAKRRLLYLKTQFIPRSKHFSSLIKTISLCCKCHKSLFVLR